MRLFIAINLPPAVRESIFADAAPLRAAASGVKWVAAHNLHVTLKFIGEVSESSVDDVEMALANVGASHTVLRVETTRVGAFPNFRRPRVVWVGMTGEAELRALARAVDQALKPLGIPDETRPFQAHLTLGRAKRELGAADAKALAQAAASGVPGRGFAVRTVDLMQSELGPGGSRYSVVAAVSLHTRGT